MSAALVRQALEFVDPDESIGKKGNRRGTRRLGSSGQVKKPLKPKVKQILNKNQEKKVAEQTVQKLLKLSQSAVDSEIAGKIVERAVKGRALADKIEINTEPEKSILFADEDEAFDQFEEELFCS